jgi:hypothetical protein
MDTKEREEGGCRRENKQKLTFNDNKTLVS